MCTPLRFADRAAWRAWLEINHSIQGEAWIVHPKKGARQTLVGYTEAVEEALCFGWIDGTLRPIDDETYTLRYSPRKAVSIWSVGNIQRVERLTAEGRMAPAGLEKVREAQENGQWAAAYEREVIDRIPADLEEALQAREGVLDAYIRQPASLKKQWLYWLASAKREETRARRVQAILAEVLQRG